MHLAIANRARAFSIDRVAPGRYRMVALASGQTFTREIQVAGPLTDVGAGSLTISVCGCTYTSQILPLGAVT